MSEWEAVTPVLVIGGAVGDLVMTLPRLPTSGEDIEAQPQARQIGGCAFNVARALVRLETPVINGMPVGNGEWGSAVEAAMGELGLEVLLRHGQMDNGWCLALVEPNGERTFITVSGCESQWNKAQLATLPLLHDEERNTWMQWFQQAGVKRPLRSIGPMFEDGLLTLAAVQAGLGCALMREPLIAHYLESGELIKMFDLPIDDGRDYYLCARLDSELSQEGENLRQWLRREAAAQNAGA